MKEVIQIGKRGVITLPSALRERLGLAEGDLLLYEVRAEGLLLRPAQVTARSVEAYTPERKAEFLLNNAIDVDDYARARREVEAMGLDPDDIEHAPPSSAA